MEAVETRSPSALFAGIALSTRFPDGSLRWALNGNLFLRGGSEICLFIVCFGVSVQLEFFGAISVVDINGAGWTSFGEIFWMVEQYGVGGALNYQVGLNLALIFQLRMCIWLIFTSICWTVVDVNIGWNLFTVTFMPSYLDACATARGEINLDVVQGAFFLANSVLYNAISTVPDWQLPVIADVSEPNSKPLSHDDTLSDNFFSAYPGVQASAHHAFANNAGNSFFIHEPTSGGLEIYFDYPNTQPCVPQLNRAIPVGAIAAVTSRGEARVPFTYRVGYVSLPVLLPTSPMMSVQVVLEDFPRQAAWSLNSNALSARGVAGLTFGHFNISVYFYSSTDLLLSRCLPATQSGGAASGIITHDVNQISVIVI